MFEYILGKLIGKLAEVSLKEQLRPAEGRAVVWRRSVARGGIHTQLRPRNVVLRLTVEKEGVSKQYIL